MLKIFPIQAILSNQYLIQNEDSSLLIDTGMQMYSKALLKRLNAHHFFDVALKMVVITHADGDHSGALGALQKHVLDPLISAASDIEAEAIRNGRMSRDLHPRIYEKWAYDLALKLFTTPKAEINLMLEENAKLQPFGLVVIATPGHTPGHISLWSEEEGVLFCGDSILIHGNRLLPSSGANNWEEEYSQESYKKQLALKPEIIYGGHGIWKRKSF